RHRRSGQAGEHDWSLPAHLRLQSNGTHSEDHDEMSEQETHSQACDTSWDDAGDVAERRARLEVRIGWRRRVQHVEDVNVDIDPPPAAEPEILACAQVQNILRREPLASVWLEANRSIAVLRDGGAAIGIDLAEDVRSLPS